MQWVANTAVMVLLAILGWYVKAMRDSVDRLKDRDDALAREVANIRTLVVGDYVKRAAFDDLGRDIFAKLESMRIESKADLKDAVRELKVELASKADK